MNISKLLVLILIFNLGLSAWGTSAKKIIKSSNWEPVFYSEKEKCYRGYYKFGGKRRKYKSVRIGGYKNIVLDIQKNLINKDRKLVLGQDFEGKEYLIVAGLDGTIYGIRELHPPYEDRYYKISNKGNHVVLCENSQFGIWDICTNSFTELRDNIMVFRFSWSEDDSKILMYRFNETQGIYIYDINNDKFTMILKQDEENPNLNCPMFFVNEEEIVYYDYTFLWKYNFVTMQKKLLMDCRDSRRLGFSLTYYDSLFGFSNLTPDRKYVIGSISKWPVWAFGVEFYGMVIVNIESGEFTILEKGRWRNGFIIPKEDSPKWKANEDSCSTLKEENDSRELKNEIPSDDKYDEQPSK